MQRKITRYDACGGEQGRIRKRKEKKDKCATLFLGWSNQTESLKIKSKVR